MQLKKYLFGALAAVAALLLVAGPTIAHVGEKAQPKIEISSASPSFWEREYTVKLTDSDSPGPISGAEVTVSGEMRSPHYMATDAVKLSATGEAGIYKGRVAFPMLAQWEMTVDVSGPNVSAAKTTFKENVRSAPAPKPGRPERSESRIPSKPQIVVDLGDVNWAGIGIQSIHLVLAIVWIGGHAFITMSLWPFLPDIPHPHRSRLFAAVIRRYAVIASACVAGIIGTGVYNALYNVPAPLTAISRQPLGDVYLGLLATKIGLLLLASLVGIYAALAIVPKLSIKSSGLDGGGSERAARRMLIASTVNLALGLAIVALAVAMRDVHMLIHGHGGL